jgi:hypothetical protein
MVATFPTRLYAVFGAGLFARMLAAAASGGSFDYTRHRLPTAGCLDAGGLLYCDCACNHTPLYPYLSALMFRISPELDWVRALFLTLPAALGDAATSLVLFVLLERIGKASVAFAAAGLYALNPVSIYEVRLAHWDGLTTLAVLLGLLAFTGGRSNVGGTVIGVGALLKQFPVVLLPLVALKERSLRKIVPMAVAAGAVVVVGFLPFLLECPAKVLASLSSHPLWNGDAPKGVGVGTVSQVFAEFGVPQPELVWFVGFGALLGWVVLHANRASLFELTGIVMVVLAYFTYATHRQLVVWALPFMIVFSVERKAPWPLVFVFVGYAIRLVKPAWYLGLVHLAAGAWYYAAMIDAIAAKRAPLSRRLATRGDAPART